MTAERLSGGVLVRLPQKYSRESKLDAPKHHKNPNSILHPLQREREYVRAVRAAKMERIFAKPFVGAMAGHREGVYAMARDGEHAAGGAVHSGELTRAASGSADGSLYLWNLVSQRSTWSANAGSFVKGLVFVPNSNALIAAGADLKLFKFDSSEVVQTWKCEAGQTGLDYHRLRPIFASSSTEGVSLWSLDRPDPVQTFQWGSDTVKSLRFNPAQVDLLAGCCSDRSVTLFDTRLRTPTAKTYLRMAPTKLSWNPQEAPYLVAGCEDHRAYCLDTRHLDRPVNVLTGHQGAVMDVDWSPTGAEIATAGYDHCIRIYDVRQGGVSRDTYHTSRMRRLQAIRFTGDSRFILSGSDDGNVRIWRAKADERVGPKTGREVQSLRYAEALKEHYKEAPEVNRILKHRHLPKWIKTDAKREREILDKESRNEANRLKHKKQGSGKRQNIRDEAVIKTSHK